MIIKIIQKIISAIRGVSFVVFGLLGWILIVIILLLSFVLGWGVYKEYLELSRCYDGC
ncbi:MAG: hypothetical protein WCJ29_06365 [bacterium]